MAKKSIPSSPIARPDKLKEPDYAHWGSADVWTLSAAAALLMEFEPAPDEAIPPGAFREKFTVVRDMLQRDTGKTTTCFAYDSEHGYRYYPWVVIEWAESSQIPFPEKLRTAVLEAWPSQFRTGAFLTEMSLLKQQIAKLESDLEKVEQETQPAYMNRAHEFFAAELEAAVAAWSAQYLGEQVVRKQAQKKQLAAWISKNYRDPSTDKLLFSNEAINRISMVANPNKAGGAPRSS